MTSRSYKYFKAKAIKKARIAKHLNRIEAFTQSAKEYNKTISDAAKSVLNFIEAIQKNLSSNDLKTIQANEQQN